MKLLRRVMAIRTARVRSKSTVPTSAKGYCLRETRECYAIGQLANDAAEAWHNAASKVWKKDGETDAEFIKRIPRGYPVFWLGGSDGHGHIAIATGFRGQCYSTDIRRDGYFDRVPIAEIRQEWGLRLVGYTRDLNGHTVED